MNTSRIASCFFGFTLAIVLTASAAAAPAVDAARAARIATDHLAQMGAGAPYITSVTLETSALVSGTQSWVVRWSSPIDAGQQREIGLRVRMDGAAIRLMQDKTAAAKKAAKRPPGR